MKDDFHQYFRPSEQAMRRLWDKAIISLDASVLLNFYGYSDETRDALTEVLKNHSERLRLPHQFALEYARNRASVIVKQINNYVATERDFRVIANKRLEPKAEHPYLSEDSRKAFESILNELSEGRVRMERMLGSDEYADLLSSSFEGKVGPCPSDEDLSALLLEARPRFDNKIPPGYMDLKDKDPPEAYGDFVAWKQLMEISKKEERGLVLVIDDQKEDWWHKEGERTIGPRPELLHEFRTFTGQDVWLYNSASFLRATQTYTKTPVSAVVIEEIDEQLRKLSEHLAKLGEWEPKVLSARIPRRGAKPALPLEAEKSVPSDAKSSASDEDASDDE